MKTSALKKSLAMGFVATGMTALASTTIHAEDIQPATNAMDTTTTTAETSNSTEVQKTTSEKLTDAQSELNQMKVKHNCQVLMMWKYYLRKHMIYLIRVIWTQHYLF